MLLEDPADPRVDPRLVEITEGGVHRSEDEQHPNTPAEQTVERFDEGRARDGWIRIVPSEKTKATPEGRPFHAEVLHEEPSALGPESISEERRADGDGGDLLPRHLASELRLPLLTSATVVDGRGHEDDPFHVLELRSHGEHG